MHKALCLFLLIGMSVILSAQRKSEKLYREALQAYSAFQINETESVLKKLLDKDPDYIDAWLLLSQVYEEKGNYSKIISSLENAVKIDSFYFVNAYHFLARAYFKTGQYNDSRRNGLIFEKHAGNNSLLRRDNKRIIQNSDFAIEAIKNPAPYNPQPLGDKVNSSDDEYWPCLNADGSEMYFTRATFNKYRQLREDIYLLSDTSDNSVSIDLNTNLNEGSQSISPDGRIMFFSACNREDGYGSCDIYYSIFNGNTWANAMNCGEKVNTKYWDSHPSVSPDLRYLYLSSDRPGGKGGRDIWRIEITKIDEEQILFGSAENLSEKINTSLHELSPFLHFDNRSLYFSSNGRIGMGNMDIYKYDVGDSTEKESVNLGYPVNSHKEEIGLIVSQDAKRAIFSKDVGEASNTQKDLFEFTPLREAKPSPASFCRGRVYDAESGDGLMAKIRLFKLEDSLEFNSFFSRKESGKFLVSLPVGDQYSFHVVKKGYLFYSGFFNMRDYEEINLDIPLKPMKKGERMILNNLFFDFDSYQLKQESYRELKMLAETLRENPGLEIRIEGHTDSVGSDSYNKKLSLQRAASVREHLISLGIDANRMEAKGYGSERPVGEDESKAYLNRRTEILILN